MKKNKFKLLCSTLVLTTVVLFSGCNNINAGESEKEEETVEVGIQKIKIMMKFQQAQKIKGGLLKNLVILRGSLSLRIVMKDLHIIIQVKNILLSLFANQKNV